MTICFSTHQKHNESTTLLNVWRYLKKYVKAHKILITKKSYSLTVDMKAIVEPKIGAWDLGDFVKDPNGQGFNGFLKTIKKHVIELRNTRHLLNDEICVRL